MDDSVAVAALIVGIVGVVVACIAAVPAFIALRDARAAGAQAEEANALSRAANGKADESNRLAREANDLVAGQVARETERHDVDWDWDWEKPGVALVVNQGHESTAYDVRVTLRIDDEAVQGTAARVAPGEALRLEFPDALAEFVREVQELEEERRPRPAPSTPWGFVPPTNLSLDPLRHLHHSWLTAHWITERGTPKQESVSGGTTYLGDHEEALRRRRLRAEQSSD